MLTVHHISDLFDLSPEQQQAILKAIRCKERLIDWIRARNLIPPKQVPVVEAHYEPCKCQKKNPAEPQRWGWIWIEDERRDESDVHPSGVTGCLKSLWFSCSGYAQEHYKFVEPSLQMIFDMGHGWHGVMQNFYGKKGAWCAPELYHPEMDINPDATNPDGTPVLPLAADYWIRGHADALIDDYRMEVQGLGEVSIRLVHEYKTINDAGYKKLTKPKPEHLWQATIYSAVFDVPFVDYLYTDKDNSQTCEYPVAFDRRLWEEITKKIEGVKYYVVNEITPPWEQTSQTLNPHECRGCGYVHLCQPPR
jgi:CRISPR/Cas system-associated exonuclease Cas4 (RecB family)